MSTMHPNTLMSGVSVEIDHVESKAQNNILSFDYEIRNEQHFEEIVGRSMALQRVLRQVEIVAPTDSGVLILGETGTGKELIARAIHNLSARRDRPFVKLNCAAIPSGLLESELFGHERGAFTGAIMRKAGRFEVADKGTLFLDEVGDIPLELQPKLLRVLQEHEFERLGSTRTQQVDVRVVAATHRALKQMMEDGDFRSDLYYRLHVFPLPV
jgi:formate hydrogenlyase transcriptional activator